MVGYLDQAAVDKVRRPKNSCLACLSSKNVRKKNSDRRKMQRNHEMLHFRENAECDNSIANES